MAETVYLTVQSDYHKVKVPVDEIQYITIEGRKTKITRADGRAICTNRSLRDVYGELSDELFTSINRGIVVSKKFIKGEKDGIVTMADGTSFRRRVRSDRLTKRPRGAQGAIPCPTDTLSQWLGGLPVPMCVMEVVYGRSSHRGAEFLLRYCNGAMEQLEGVKLSEVRDKPLEQLPGVGEKKWLSVFVDVAINGSARTLETPWRDGEKFYRLHCYQPQPGFCTLALVDLTKETKLVQELFQRGK